MRKRGRQYLRKRRKLEREPKRRKRTDAALVVSDSASSDPTVTSEETAKAIKRHGKGKRARQEATARKRVDAPVMVAHEGERADTINLRKKYEKQDSDKARAAKNAATSPNAESKSMEKLSKAQRRSITQSEKQIKLLTKRSAKLKESVKAQNTLARTINKNLIAKQADIEATDVSTKKGRKKIKADREEALAMVARGKAVNDSLIKKREDLALTKKAIKGQEASIELNKEVTKSKSKSSSKKGKGRAAEAEKDAAAIDKQVAALKKEVKAEGESSKAKDKSAGSSKKATSATKKSSSATDKSAKSADRSSKAKKKSIRTLEAKSRALKAEAKALKLETVAEEKNTRATGKNTKSKKKNEQATKGATKAGNAMSNAFGRAARVVAILQGPLGPISGRLTAIGVALRTMNPLVLGMGLAFAAAGMALRALMPSMGNMQAIMGSLEATTTDAAAAFQLAKDETFRTGGTLRETAGEYAKFAAAAKGTALEGSALNRVFKAVNTAALALRLSPAQASGALKALEQMISKGKVSAEELRGQLGERLPGAFRLAADAMGVTTAKLDDMLRKGELTAEEMLPKLAERLEATFGEAAAKASNDLNVALDRVMGSFTLFKEALTGGDFTTILAGWVNSLAESLQGLADNIDKVKAAAAAALAGIVFFVAAINGEAINAAAVAMWRLVVATRAMSAATAVMAVVSAPITGTILAIAGAALAAWWAYGKFLSLFGDDETLKEAEKDYTHLTDKIAGLTTALETMDKDSESYAAIADRIGLIQDQVDRSMAKDSGDKTRTDGLISQIQDLKEELVELSLVREGMAEVDIPHMSMPGANVGSIVSPDESVAERKIAIEKELLRLKHELNKQYREKAAADKKAADEKEAAKAYKRDVTKLKTLMANQSKALQTQLDKKEMIGLKGEAKEVKLHELKLARLKRELGKILENQTASAEAKATAKAIHNQQEKVADEAHTVVMLDLARIRRDKLSKLNETTRGITASNEVLSTKQSMDAQIQALTDERDLKMSNDDWSTQDELNFNQRKLEIEVEHLGAIATLREEAALIKLEYDLLEKDAEFAQLHSKNAATQAEIEAHEAWKIARAQQTANAIANSSKAVERAQVRAKVTTNKLLNKVDQERMDMVKGFLSGMSTLMNSNSRKMFEVGKAAAISTTVINTIEAAWEAFKGTQKALGGGPWATAAGAVAAAGVAMKGYQQVQAIASTQFGSQGAGVASGGGIPNIGGGGVGTFQDKPPGFDPMKQRLTTPGSGNPAAAAAAAPQVIIHQTIDAAGAGVGAADAIREAAAQGTQQAMAAVSQDFVTNGPLRQTLGV